MIRVSRIENLPPELVNHIIDEIAHRQDTPEARRALRCCLFLSRSFRQSASRHLFRSLKLTDARNVAIEDIENLLQIIAPRHGYNTGTDVGGGIAQYVQEFSLEFEKESSENLLDDSNGTVADILSNLQGAQYGVISFSWKCPKSSYNGSGSGWMNLSTYLQKSIISFLHSPHLKTARLVNIHDLPTSLFHGSYLEHIYLQNTAYRKLQKVLTYTPDGQFVMVDPDEKLPPPPSLHSLQIDNRPALGCFMIINPSNPKEVTSISNLQSFTSPIRGTGDLFNVRTIIEKAAKSLIYLSLTFDINSSEKVFDSPPAPLDLAQCISLRCLKITLLRSQPSEDGNGAGKGVEHIASILDITTPFVNLPKIDFKIEFTNITRTDLHFFHDWEVRWDALDSILSGHKYWRIQSKSLVCKIIRCEESLEKAAMDKLRTFFTVQALRRTLSASNQYRFIVDSW